MWDHDTDTVHCDGPSCINAAHAPVGVPAGWLILADANEGTEPVIVCGWRCLARLASSFAAAA